ncbi:MAG: hypothetical protein AB1486_34745 [Planctomycetota bacterium]
MAALGEALPPEARSGLALFLSRGMWGWARTLAAPGVREMLTGAPSHSPAASWEHRAVIHVLASMVINSHDRRAP